MGADHEYTTFRASPGDGGLMRLELRRSLRVHCEKAQDVREPLAIGKI
jgi:hypothetical protein